MADQKVLELLAKEFPTADAASAEIINLSAIVRLPKGTEYFFSDIHGEADAFAHLLGTASGVISSKIETLFQNSVPAPERAELSSLIAAPEDALEAHCTGRDADWCRVVIFRLIHLCKSVASKYTRSKVRKTMPPQFSYALDELLHADTVEDKEDYYNAIVSAIIENGVSVKFIVALCGVIRQCSIDVLHIIGDIFDRGPHADLVMEALAQYKNVDIQWGNHDIHWMGAAAGNATCVANVVRLAISYNNFDLLEDAYGINLRPLSAFATEVYGEDPCDVFRPHLLDENQFDPIDESLAAKMHKAIAIIGFKLEGALLARHPEYGMESRDRLSQIDFASGTIMLNGTPYSLRDTHFPTVDPAAPLALTDAEQDLVFTLTRSFKHSPTLQSHIRYLYNKGSMYKKVNGNLLYHGCIPLDGEGRFKQIVLDGKALCGKAYLDAIDAKIRAAFFAPEGSKARAGARDYMWYLWCGPDSPIFGKDQLTTFERYFIESPAVWEEHYNPYFKYIKNPENCQLILKEFGLDPETGHIINGHVPVRIKKGESPVKAEGRLFVIDGGISKAYHEHTGIGGYTLISNSHSLSIAEHLPFKDTDQRPPRVVVVERYPKRVKVADTDNGRTLLAQIEDLKELLAAYRSGSIQEQTRR